MPSPEGVRPPVRAQLALPFTVDSVTEARHRLGDQLEAAGVNRVTVQTACVIVSELVANGVRHGRGGARPALEVAWETRGDDLVISVADGGGASLPVVRPPDLDSDSGRGLMMVAGLSRRWSYDTSRGTTVRAEIELV